MGPFPICKIKTGLAVLILEGLVHRERSSPGIELHQEQAILRAGGHQTLRFRVPTRPVREEAAQLTEDEINTAIDEAVAAVRRSRA